MTHFNVRRGETGDARARISSMAHLQHASKDINDWRFECRPRTASQPKSCDHNFVGIDKTTGIESVWPCDEVDANEAGDFEAEHRRIVSEFATWLQHLDAAMRLAKQKQMAQQSRLILPKRANAVDAARSLLLKGDHPHLYGRR